MDWPVTLTVCEPETWEDESPGPETLQLAIWDAGVALQEILVLPPPETQVGLALMETFGETTVTETDAVGPTPPEFVQYIVYVVSADGLTWTSGLASESVLLGRPPVEKSGESQRVAPFVEVQVSVADWPLSIVAVAAPLTRSVASGGGGGVPTVTEASHAFETLWLPDVTRTLPVFVPAVA